MRGRRQATAATIAALLAAAILPAYAADDGIAHTIFVPASVIYPGDEITPESLTTIKVMRPEGSEAPFGEDENDLVGKVARRTLLAGQPVPASGVRTKDIITQGRTYKLVYHSEFVTIVGNGVPLQSAAAGEIVNVRNPDTGVIVKARVNADQTLAIDEQ